MKIKNTNEDLIISHLEYIRTRVDQINGRVRDNERDITAIKTIGTTVTIILSITLTILGVFK
tara:strand:- start:22712 stop:22897 length:186 start_codon:yes stop_codon:yes gene_type:complete